jgi:hypothetical protein
VQAWRALDLVFLTGLQVLVCPHVTTARRRERGWKSIEGNALGPVSKGNVAVHAEHGCVRVHRLYDRA